MDEFNQAWTSGEADDLSKVFGGFLGSEGEAIGAFEPAEALFDATPGLGERSGGGGGLVHFVGLVWDDRGDAARSCCSPFALLE